ncbi:unnamed protein product [Arctia plantaginis]|uniref:Uncharacterized protein n=1 Tax=Arctia plantaginis TaxID=874455 RepID=A0A8S1BFL3_ARCPL|nr:unnamed protein product [Arctia plantaginis]
MISSSNNRVQKIKNQFESLNNDIVPVRIESQLYKHKHGFSANVGKENTENKIDCNLSPNKDIDITNESESSDECSPKPNNSYLYNKIDVKRSVSDTKNSLSRQISDPGKKLHRSHAFRCDRSQKIISNTPKRHGSCNGRAETSDFSFKMERKLSKDRLKRLGNFLEDQMRKENFHPPVYTQVIEPTSEPVLADSIPDSDVPEHILQQYAQVVKPKKKDVDKQDAMTDSGVSSETENIDDDKAGRVKKLKSQFEKPSEKTNLPAMDEFCNSSDTIRLELKNPHLKLTDTLKKALKQPLPAGPPPKKPPRVFNSKPTISEEDIEQQKREAKRKLEKLENLLLQKREGTEKPDKNQNFQKKPKEIHYLCTEILDITNRTLLPNQTSDPISRCLNSLNCAITNNSTSSLPYTHLNAENQATLMTCCTSSLDSIEENQRKCTKCTINDGKEHGFKCHLNCKCVVKNSEFYVSDHIYDVPYSEDDIKIVKKNKYGSLNTLKSSRSMDDLRLKTIKD